MPSTYKHIFFDLDHTLWDFETNAKEAMELLFEKTHLQQKTHATFHEFYIRYSYHNEIMWDRYTKGFLSRDDLKWKRMWRTLLDFKVADEQLSREMGVEFLAILPTRKNLFPHAIDTLEYLRSKGYSMHLITNGFEAVQQQKIFHSGLQPFFEHMITSEKSMSVKPQKEIFDYALKVANAQLEASIMIGDNAEADIQGAINAGMDSIYVDHLEKEISQQPTYTVKNLLEITHIL